MLLTIIFVYKFFMYYIFMYYIFFYISLLHFLLYSVLAVCLSITKAITLTNKNRSNKRDDKYYKRL